MMNRKELNPFFQLKETDKALLGFNTELYRVYDSEDLSQIQRLLLKRTSCFTCVVCGRYGCQSHYLLAVQLNAYELERSAVLSQSHQEEAANN